uniref:Cerebellin 18 n=1 Tax=Myripristis murdjan TaxID=586833 RepID=A0A667Y272_9TELE
QIATSLSGSCFLLHPFDSCPSISLMSFNGQLTCAPWNCECAFMRQRGCCCASNKMFELEETTFMRMTKLWGKLTKLTDSIAANYTHIAFTATMAPTPDCFGPFTTNVTISYNNILLNDGHGYNPALGVFTAPRCGAYVMSFRAYSNVGSPTERLYHKVQMMKNGEVVASMWEANREDMEDSGTQVVVVDLKRGDQIYMELMYGRSLCGTGAQKNIFSGYLLYPTYENWVAA